MSRILQNFVMPTQGLRKMSIFANRQHLLSWLVTLARENVFECPDKAWQRPQPRKSKPSPWQLV